MLSLQSILFQLPCLDRKKIKWHCWIYTLSNLHPLHSELALAVSSPQGRIRGTPKVIFSPVSCDFLSGLHILHNIPY